MLCLPDTRKMSAEGQTAAWSEPGSPWPQVQCAALETIPLIPASKLKGLLKENLLFPSLVPAMRSPLRVHLPDCQDHRCNLLHVFTSQSSRKSLRECPRI